MNHTNALLFTLQTIAPLPDLGFVLQLAGTGTAVGSAAALRMHHRDPGADTWSITTAWSLAALLIGAVVVAIERLS